MSWYGWCTETLEEHSRSVLSFARGTFDLRSHRRVVEALNALGLDVATRSEIYGSVSNDIRRTFGSACRRIGVVLGIDRGTEVLEDLVSISIALHDIGKASDLYVANVVKALSSSTDARCRVSKDRLLKMIDIVEKRFEEFSKRLGSERSASMRTVFEFLSMLRERIETCPTRFGCPLTGSVCPLTFVFETYLEYVSRYAASRTRCLELAYVALLRMVKKICRCFVRPSFVGHELLSAYVARELLYRTLRELDGVSWARRIRNALTAILSISILLHHHAMRSIEEAIARISSYSAITVLSVDDNVRNAVVSILKSIENLSNRSRAFDTALSIAEKLPSIEIPLPTFLDYVLSVDREAMRTVKLYTVAVAPLCKSDTIASYVCRGCGAPTYLAKEAILRSLRKPLRGAQ